jgi:hypothetical protein
MGRPLFCFARFMSGTAMAKRRSLLCLATGSRLSKSNRAGRSFGRTERASTLNGSPATLLPTAALCLPTARAPQTSESDRPENPQR